jgi:N4-gp56 family major capsid protein
MAINLATKYSNKVDERFSIKSLTEGIGLNKDYDWSGVKTVTVYGIDNATMNNYTRTGVSRYGTPTELTDTTKDYSLSKDRSFSTTIDKGNNTEQLMIKSAGKFLSRQTNEVIIPEIDIYRLAVWSAAGIANSHTAAEATTASNAYVQFLAAQAALDEDKVPVTGRICFVTPAYHNFLKQDSSFIQASDMAQKMLINGQVGEVDGVKIVKAPSSYFPANHSFILMHPKCSISPKKLEDYNVHENPPGISGHLIEGRIIYDCFVLEQKKNAIYVHTTA